MSNGCDAAGAGGGGGGAVRLRVPDRAQVSMAVSSPDGLVGPGHRARVVWAVVCAMDLAEFAAPIRARDGVGGRDATDPRLLVSLWLYASIRGVGSARELARLCRESAPYRWLCGGVGVNHHLLSDFRTGHAAALDALFTRTIAALVGQGLVAVRRVSRDGVRVRASAGASSFRRGATPARLLADAEAHVRELASLADDPARSAGLSAKKRAARVRAARGRVERIGRAIAALPALEARQQKQAKKLPEARRAKQRPPRASTTDAEARVMKMPDGGFRPAVNVQLAVDTQSRAVVGVDVTDQGSDNGLADAMRAQVERRTGGRVEEHLVDGGFARAGLVERAAAEGVTLYMPPREPCNRRPGAGTGAGAGRPGPKRTGGCDRVPGESPPLAEWRARMGSEGGKAVYKERAATAETVNADLTTHRGLGRRLLVRGLDKAKCVVLWSALAYNVLHFAAALVA